MDKKLLDGINKIFIEHVKQVESNISSNDVLSSKLKNSITVDAIDYGIVIKTPLYGWIIDQGSKQHEIKAKNKDYLHFQIEGNWVKVKSVVHPGTKARPWVENVFDLETLSKQIAILLGNNLADSIETKNKQI